MVKFCVVCGNKLRTGNKYCYIHRSLQHKKSYRSRNDASGFIGLIMFLIIISILLVAFQLVNLTSIVKLWGIALAFFVGIPLLIWFVMKKVKEKKAEPNLSVD